MSNETIELKNFNMRMPKEIWLFLKHTSAHKGISMTDIIVACVEKYKKRIESKLTQ